MNATLISERNEYKQLVKEIADTWRGRPGNVHKVQLSWCEDNHEVNLWNYWQGFGNTYVDIVVMGQDWGNPENNSQIMGNIKKIQSGDDSAHYCGRYDSSKLSVTDENLKALVGVLRTSDGETFKEIDTRRYDGLFFTNYCLGYRSGQESGGMTHKIMEQDDTFFIRLLKILKPKVVICLGKITYERAVSVLSGKSFRIHNYNDCLNTGKNVYQEGDSPFVFGMGHCGNFGTNRNRVRGIEKYPELAGKSGLELMMLDWKRVNEYL